jgi:hypothetical protein
VRQRNARNAFWLALASGIAGLAAPSHAATETTPSSVTINPLDVAIVTTGGPAVTAINAGHRSAGGWLLNPSTATIPLCINKIGTASGTTSAGSTTCIAPGQPYTVAPGIGPVSVVSSDSAHAFSGEGFQKSQTQSPRDATRTPGTLRSDPGLQIWTARGRRVLSAACSPNTNLLVHPGDSLRLGHFGVSSRVIHPVVLEVWQARRCPSAAEWLASRRTRYTRIP